MMAFIKKHWQPIALFVAALLLIQGASFTLNIMRAKAQAAAEAKYQAVQAELNAKIAAKVKAYNDLSEKAGKDRETLRASAEAELRRSANAFSALKSESAATLRARNATIAKVLSEKKLDELAIIEAKETIDYLGTLEIATLWAWKISDENKDAAHNGIVLDLESKYAACESWRLRIAKSQRMTIWKSAVQYLKYGAVFGAGYAAGRYSGK